MSVRKGEENERERTRHKCFHARRAGRTTSPPCLRARQTRGRHHRRGPFREERRLVGCPRVLRPAACPFVKGPYDRTFSASSLFRYLFGCLPHRLDLITDEQDVMLRAKLADLEKVSRGREDDPCFALAGFDEECGDLLAMELERSPNVFNFTISNSVNRITIMVRRTHAGEVRAET